MNDAHASYVLQRNPHFFVEAVFLVITQQRAFSALLSLVKFDHALVPQVRFSVEQHLKTSFFAPGALQVGMRQDSSYSVISGTVFNIFKDCFLNISMEGQENKRIVSKQRKKALKFGADLDGKGLVACIFLETHLHTCIFVHAKQISRFHPRTSMFNTTLNHQSVIKERT